MSDVPDPPRKFYGLKPKEFEVVNPSVGAPGAVPPPDTGNPQPVTNGAIDVRELFKSANRDPNQRVLASPHTSPAAVENEVHAILRANHARAEAAGLNALAPRAHRRSRRTRDYLVLLIAGNLFIAVVYAAELILGFQVQCLAAEMPGEFLGLVKFALHQPVVFVMAGVGMLFYSGCLTWVMFGIMDDY